MKGRRVAFVFGRSIAYPPNIHDMKCYYVTKELIARGNKVTWVKLGGKDKNHFAEGIEFTRIPIPPTNPLLTFFSLLRLVLFCVARRIQIVYLDEWLFFRHRPVSRLAGVIGLRLSGAKVVLDERDPLVDFETATGEFSAGSKWDRVAVRATRLSERLSNLVILTSKAYEQLYVSDGFPAKKVMGIFRGVDPKLFRPIAGPYSVRSKLGLDGKFVVGWFGLMHPFRQIREVLVPIAREITRTIPDGHVLIGGEGPQFSEFQSLSSEDNISVTVLGFVPYADLPKYIAACDVLLCPVDTRFRFTQHSAWLKIVEALAVGRPVIAAKTMISDLDYKDLKGVTWVDSDLPNFMKALEEIKQNYAPHLSQAQDQARHMEDFTVPRTIAKIVERVELLAGAPTG